MKKKRLAVGGLTGLEFVSLGTFHDLRGELFRDRSLNHVLLILLVRKVHIHSCAGGRHNLDVFARRGVLQEEINVAALVDCDTRDKTVDVDLDGARRRDLDSGDNVLHDDVALFAIGDVDAVDLAGDFEDCVEAL